MSPDPPDPATVAPTSGVSLVDPLPFFVCGPTASGKSAYALQLAEQLDGEIVNADAFQLYSGMEVLSAAPSSGDLAACPHHLYGVLSPTTTNDAGQFHRLALPVIAEIQSRGKTPIITGGSGLYLKFLSHGPSPLPPGDATMRTELDAMPVAALFAELQRCDPTEAARLGPHNHRYLSRAVEIFRLTGEPASRLRDAWQTASLAREARLRGVWLQHPRATLHERIAQRTRWMLNHGAIEEVQALSAIASATCRKAIGFAEIEALLAGTIDLPTCEALLCAATRQYAKRQETWFRRESWLVPVSSETSR